MSLIVKNIAKRFDETSVLSDLSFEAKRGDVIGIIGPNGAGKTTLLNVVSGFVRPSGGSISFNDMSLNGLSPYEIARLGVSRSFQEVRVIRQLSVHGNLLLSSRASALESLTKALLFRKWDRRDDTERNASFESILKQAGLSKLSSERVGNLSYGQQKLLSLSCCLASYGRLILLDEPVSGVAPAMADRISELMRAFTTDGRIFLIVEHNIERLRAVCNRMMFLRAGVKISEGTPDEVLCDPRVMQAYLQ